MGPLVTYYIINYYLDIHVSYMYVQSGTSGAAIEWQEPRPEVNLDVDLTAEENEEEVDAGTSASVEVESMMDDEEEVAQKNGESVNVEYMFETLTYCDQKYKREMGVNEMPASRYTSNSTRGIITKDGRRK